MTKNIDPYTLNPGHVHRDVRVCGKGLRKLGAHGHCCIDSSSIIHKSYRMEIICRVCGSGLDKFGESPEMGAWPSLQGCASSGAWAQHARQAAYNALLEAQVRHQKLVERLYFLFVG